MIRTLHKTRDINMKKQIMVAVSLMLLTAVVNGQPAKISGRVIGSNHDSVQIRFMEVQVNGASIGSETHMLMTDEDGRFAYSSPSLQRPGRIEIQYFGNNRKYQNLYNGLFHYILLPADSIYMDITRGDSHLSYVFSGRGASRFQCRREIDESLEAIDQVELKTPADTALWNWKKQLKYSDSIIQLQDMILNKYKRELSPDIYALLRADVIGIVRLYYVVPMFTAEAFAQHPDYYKQQMLKAMQLKIDTTNGSLLALSPTYVNYVCFRTRLEQIVLNKFDSRLIGLFPINYGLMEWYNRLKKEYRGPLRDMAIMRLLSEPEIGVNNSDYELCLADARKTISTPYVKEMISNWSRAQMKGSPVYDFSLPDTAGNMIALSQFKGKVICIDTWFTGCAGCANLAADFKENLYPQFIHDTSVVFVSISGDTNKATWMASVRDEKYSSAHCVNVFTNGKGFDHPFMKYYGFYGGPYLMLIDKSFRVYSGRPPRTPTELAALIREVSKL